MQHESANNHNHQPGEDCDLHATDPHEEEADHQDEIILPAEQAARTDFEVQAVKESNFTSVIHCSGEITASPDDQKFLSSPVSGIVVFSGKNPAEGILRQSRRNIVLHLDPGIGYGRRSRKSPCRL